MEREILFHGKRLDNGEWVEGHLLSFKAGQINPNRSFILPFASSVRVELGAYTFGGFVEVDPATVGQYTGLADKIGKKIFEGDIIRFRLERKWFICSVQWSNAVCAFVAKINDDDPNDFFFLDGYMLEVVGNIWDNPELLI